MPSVVSDLDFYIFPPGVSAVSGQGCLLCRLQEKNCFVVLEAEFQLSRNSVLYF